MELSISKIIVELTEEFCTCQFTNSLSLYVLYLTALTLSTAFQPKGWRMVLLSMVGGSRPSCVWYFLNRIKKEICLLLGRGSKTVGPVSIRCSAHKNHCWRVEYFQSGKIVVQYTKPVKLQCIEMKGNFRKFLWLSE